MTPFKLSSLFKQYRGMIFLSAVTSVMFSSLALTMPIMLKLAIDRAIPSHDWGLFALLAVIMLLIYTIRFFMRLITGYIGTYTVTRILMDVRFRIFKHLQSLSLRFYEEYRTGKLISNVISDVGLLSSLITLCINTVDQIFTMFFITIALFFLNWQLAILALCVMPLHFINFYLSNKSIRRDAIHLQEKVSEISANLAETINGIKVVKSFSKERAENRHFFNNLRPMVDLSVKMNIRGNYCHGIHETLVVLTYLGIIAGGLICCDNVHFTIGDFVAFYTYVGIQVGPIAMIAGQMNSISQGLAGAKRVMNVLSVIPEIQDDPDAVTAERFTGKIVFDHVSFSYHDNTPVLKDFSLTINPGEKVALVGPSGCGKSTIGNLLLRFYDVTGGSIRIDDHDIRDFTQESYRSNIGVVLQEPFLFSGTIHQNLAYARPDATMEEVRTAADTANVNEFVSKLPKKYETIIGENGASLSGGQKQRIAIARAVLKNPAILLLDEATSALDTVSERLVQQALDALMHDRTSIIIAHRLSTIRNADKIVVLKNGSIDQMGSHDELMELGGTYKDLYLSQMKASKENGTDADNIFYRQHPRALELEKKLR